ncbi:hypothetical protein JCGZ_16687 [Jatropha curcas]|uniref:Uncharacterized protein n=1 Tax=Jatropha curcas TaxID=180498 RepID=A0A067K3F5_JATCU|nr:hypothetical protein JCGZ_16687 [Jatropha curcas]
MGRGAAGGGPVDDVGDLHQPVLGWSCQRRRKNRERGLSRTTNALLSHSRPRATTWQVGDKGNGDQRSNSDAEEVRFAKIELRGIFRSSVGEEEVCSGRWLKAMNAKSQCRFSLLSFPAPLDGSKVSIGLLFDAGHDSSFSSQRLELQQHGWNLRLPSMMQLQFSAILGDSGDDRLSGHPERPRQRRSYDRPARPQEVESSSPRMDRGIVVRFSIVN